MIWFCEVLDGPWQGTYICKEQELQPGVVQNEAQWLCFATENCEVGQRFQLVSPTALRGSPATPEELRTYYEIHIYELSDRIEDDNGIQTRVEYRGLKQHECN